MSAYSEKDIKLRNGIDFIISPFRGDRVTPLGYDFSVEHALVLSGGRGRGGGRGQVYSCVSNDSFLEIAPHSFSLLVSRERVWLSKRIMGVLHSRGSLSAKGLVLNSTTVSPQWSGKMIFGLYNASPFPVKIRLNDPILTMLFFRVNSEPHDQINTSPFSVLKDHYSSHVDSEVLDKFLAEINEIGSPLESSFKNEISAASSFGFLKRFSLVFLNSLKKKPLKFWLKLVTILGALAGSIVYFIKALVVLLA